MTDITASIKVVKVVKVVEGSGIVEIIGNEVEVSTWNIDRNYGLIRNYEPRLKVTLIPAIFAKRSSLKRKKTLDFHFSRELIAFV
ncbi:hypothetical protein V1477_015290 [Vespula maculifrons]|uniref:Uncharacterized protein n=1 Tax=Vespula maculifrons TaxID=7453 RepID=A0ABD2BKD7_VESMC